MGLQAAKKEIAVNRQTRLISWPGWGFGGLALGLLLAKVAFSLNIIWQIFNFAFQVDESEGMIVAETLLMQRGTNIYAPLTAERFIAAPYTPIYYLLNWPVFNLTGPSFKPGRFISFLALCGIAFVLYKLVARYSQPGGFIDETKETKHEAKTKIDRVSATAAALFWGSLGLAAFWGSAVKPDMLALCFSLSGVYATFRYVTATRQERWFYFSIGLFGLAVLTKQTAFAGPLACAIFLAVNVSFKTALRFVGLWAGLAFGPMLLMNVLSNGGFWYHIVTVHELPWSADNYAKFLGAFVQNYQLYLLLALGFIISVLFDITKKTLKVGNLWLALRHYPASLFLLYFGTSAGASFSAGTYGGNHNHLLELAAAMCLCAGALLVRLRSWRVSHKGLTWLYPVVLGLICLQTLGLFVAEGRVKPEDFPVLGATAPTEAGLKVLQSSFSNPQWLGLEYRVPPESLKAGLGQVAAFMTNDVGPLVYSDNVSLALASGKPLMTTDPFTQTHATYFKRWDETYLISLIERKQFHLIVLRAPIEDRLALTGEARDIYLSPGLAQAILANYRLTQPNVAYIYEPR